MKYAAGITAILGGLGSLTYIGIYGYMIGSAASFLGSFGQTGNAVSSWGSWISTLSWVTPMLAVVGGMVTFANPALGGVLLAGSTFACWELLGFGSIGRMFVIPIGASSVMAFIASLSETPSRQPKQRPVESSADDASSPQLDRRKWEALLEYDRDVAEAASLVRPLGQAWLDEFATAFLALNDKSYLPGLVEKITARAKSEEKEREQRREEQRVEEAQRQQEYRQEQERRAKARRERRAIWQQRIWGTRQRKLSTSGVCALILLTGAGVAWRLTAPPARPSDRIMWDGYPENCWKKECLREAMSKAGASREAIDFAEKLTSAGQGTTNTWAVGRLNFGLVDLVIYSCQAAGRCGGYAFVDRDLRIIFPLRQVSFPNYTSMEHPQAMVTNYDEFVGPTDAPGGRKRYMFQTSVGDCMACEPYWAVQYAVDFDPEGHYLGSSLQGSLPWAKRPAATRVPSVYDTVAVPPEQEKASASHEESAETVQLVAPPPTKPEYSIAVSSGGRTGDLRARIRQISDRINAVRREDLTNLVAGIATDSAEAAPPRSAEARKLNDEGLAALKRGDVSAAVAVLQKASLLNPGDTEIAANLGYAELKSNDLAAAEKHLIASILISPTRASSWGSLGATLASAGAVADATVCFLVAFSVSRSQDASKRFFNSLAKDDPNANVREASSAALELFDSSLFAADLQAPR